MLTCLLAVGKNNLKTNKMTPKEKAKELVEKMRLKMPPTIIPTASTKTNQLSCDIDLKGNTKNAKQCALIAVDEILNLEPPELSYLEPFSKSWWQEV